jgi:hypothetical protein
MTLRIVAVFFLAIALPSSAQAAAAKPVVRSYVSCTELADQRGFLANEHRGARKHFVRACMHGEQT